MFYGKSFAAEFTSPSGSSGRALSLHQNPNFSPFLYLTSPSPRNPALTLGTRFRPGQSNSEFCKPTDVVVLRQSGDFFVADGYCNARVLRFNSDGKFVSQIGQTVPVWNSGVGQAPPPLNFAIPHALALDDEQKVLFIADRENKRVQAVHTETGEFALSLDLKEFHPALYSMCFERGFWFWKIGLRFIFVVSQAESCLP